MAKMVWHTLKIEDEWCLELGKTQSMLVQYTRNISKTALRSAKCKSQIAMPKSLYYLLCDGVSHVIKDNGFSARANDIAEEITGGEKGKKKSRRWEKKSLVRKPIKTNTKDHHKSTASQPKWQHKESSSNIILAEYTTY